MASGEGGKEAGTPLSDTGANPSTRLLQQILNPEGEDHETNPKLLHASRIPRAWEGDSTPLRRDQLF